MNETTMTPTDEDLIADAEARRQLKAFVIQNAPLEPIADTVEARMANLQAKVQANLRDHQVSVAADPHEQQSARLLREAGVPKRHAWPVAPAIGPWHDSLAKMVSRLGNGFMIALTGIQGAGKTQMGSALIYAATAKLISARYAVAMDFFISLKETYDGGKRSESEIIASFAKPKLLVLDEMDERSESAWEDRLLFHMLNKRHDAMYDTLLISRRSQEQFLASLGESLQGRVLETGGCIVCDWPSYREAASGAKA